MFLKKISLEKTLKIYDIYDICLYAMHFMTKFEKSEIL